MGSMVEGVLLTAVQLWSGNEMSTYHLLSDQTPNLSSMFYVTFLPFVV